MPWWLIWLLLVLAALALFVWLGIRLWRIGRGLLAELERAEVVLDRLDARLAELEEAASRARAIEPELLLGPERRAELHASRARVRQARAGRRRVRYDRASRVWDDITGPSS